MADMKYGTFSEYQKLTLTWQNINVHLPVQSSGFLSKLKKKTQPSRTHIIQDGLFIKKI